MLDDVLEVVLDVLDVVDVVDIGHTLLGDRKKKQAPQTERGKKMEPSNVDPWDKKQEKPMWEK